MKGSIIIFISVTLSFIGCQEKRKHKQYLSVDNTVINSTYVDNSEINRSSVDCNDCPIEGNAKTVKSRELNVLKNRSNFPTEKDFDININLTSLLKSGDDKKRWNNTSAAKIIGYVRDVKPGGIETANCKSKDKNSKDTHIELVLNPMSVENNESFVVEITPRLRKIMATKGEDWSTSFIRSKYLGRWVEIEGWMLFDFEHCNTAENTNPGNIKNRCGTSWEIHPVTKIKIAVKH